VRLTALRVLGRIFPAAHQENAFVELLDIAQLKPGLTVAKAVTNAGGAVLCPPGFQLTETAIERLRNAGVKAVIVEGHEDKAPELKARVDALEARFAGVEDPILLQLKALIANRLNFMQVEQGGRA
jgi:hypothetical protein